MIFQSCFVNKQLTIVLKVEKSANFFQTKTKKMSLFRMLSESFQFTHTGPDLNASRNAEFVNVNYPLSMPANLKYRTTMTAPSGNNLQLVVPTPTAQQNCSEGNFLQVLNS